MHTQAAELMQLWQPCLQVTGGSRYGVQVEDWEAAEIGQRLQSFLCYRCVVIQQLQVRQLQRAASICEENNAKHLAHADILNIHAVSFFCVIPENTAKEEVACYTEKKTP